MPQHVTQRGNRREPIFCEHGDQDIHLLAVVMNDDHLLAALRYVSLNPVRAKLVSRVEDWPWSRMHANLKAENDGLMNVQPVLSRIPDFAGFLAQENESGFDALRTSEGTGRPLGNAEFITGLERILGRALAKARAHDDRQRAIL
jgi:putative transposase